MKREEIPQAVAAHRTAPRHIADILADYLGPRERAELRNRRVHSRSQRDKLWSAGAVGEQLTLDVRGAA